MRYAFCCMIAAAVTITGSSGEKGKKSDLQGYQGTWQAVYVHTSYEKPLPKDKVDAVSLVVKGNKFVFTTADATMKGTFSLDESKKTIDVTVNLNESTKITVLGIYRIEKNQRRSCFAMPNEPRPTKFEKKKGFTTLVWQRKK